MLKAFFDKKLVKKPLLNHNCSMNLKLFKNLLLCAFIVIICFFNTYSIAQTNEVSNSEIGVSLIPGCSLSNLVTTGNQNITDASKQSYTSNCIQGIIRFVIILASLSAILSIASTGIGLLSPGGSSSGSKSASKSIQNLVIGLLLLTVAWNILPIFNASFGNNGFLNIPKIDNCSITNSCIENIKSISVPAKTAVEKYTKAIKDKKFTGTEPERQSIILGVKSFCDTKGSPKYKDEYKGLDVNICKDDIGTKLAGLK
jgi:hypothetical protein